MIFESVGPRVLTLTPLTLGWESTVPLFVGIFQSHQMESAVTDWTPGSKLECWTEVGLDTIALNWIVLNWTRLNWFGRIRTGLYWIGLD